MSWRRSFTWRSPYVGIPTSSGPLDRGSAGFHGSDVGMHQVGDRFTYGLNVLSLPRGSDDTAVIASAALNVRRRGRSSKVGRRWRGQCTTRFRYPPRSLLALSTNAVGNYSWASRSTAPFLLRRLRDHLPDERTRLPLRPAITTGGLHATIRTRGRELSRAEGRVIGTHVSGEAAERLCIGTRRCLRRFGGRG